MSMAEKSFFDFREQLLPPRGNKASAPAGKPESMLTVSQLTKLVDKAIRGGMPASVSVRGEVSNFAHNRGSGHAYFTLKDADACLNCVMFRGEFERLKFVPQNGMELLATGNVRVFAAQGKYQLYVNTLQPLGKGALELAVAVEAGNRGAFFGGAQTTAAALSIPHRHHHKPGNRGAGGYAQDSAAIPLAANHPLPCPGSGRIRGPANHRRGGVRQSASVCNR
jgi:hypothetical protein